MCACWQQNSSWLDLRLRCLPPIKLFPLGLQDVIALTSWDKVSGLCHPTSSVWASTVACFSFKLSIVSVVESNYPSSLPFPSTTTSHIPWPSSVSCSCHLKASQPSFLNNPDMGSSSVGATLSDQLQHPLQKELHCYEQLELSQSQKQQQHPDKYCIKCLGTDYKPCFDCETEQTSLNLVI